IGVHVSIAGSIDLSFDRAKKTGCDTFQIFTRNPRGWNAKPLASETIIDFLQKNETFNLTPIFAHIPYLANLASPESDILQKSLTMFQEELIRCNDLNIPFLITHLGSPKKLGKEFGKEQIKNSINSILEISDEKTVILLENSAGKSGSLGSNIEDICEIINSIEKNERLGICFDTCHAFASGYDLRKDECIENIVNSIDVSIGIDKLKCVHSNDSLFDLGEGRDRHEHLGLGKIGKIGFTNLIRSNEIRKIPFICETPVDQRCTDEGNIQFLRDLFDHL
ncbi:MAG: deoxyribonuclease IV, partial [Candidatus Thorarchaeota archaeon]